MAAKTEQFKSAGSNIGRTIGQSWSMITGKDVANYSLLFLDETLTRKRGEHETIFMPHIVLGRSSRCHVRYGDAFRTVSREHASITVDGNSFVLNHNPSASNPTYVNGRTIGGSHFLQNGDEIQLSSNGPKIRFNASTLKTSTIGLTSRIGQAMSQAVKPYQKALYVLGFLLIAALGFAGYNMYQNAQLNKELVELTKAGEDVDREIAELIAAGKENSAEMDRLRAEKQRIVYRTNVIRERSSGNNKIVNAEAEEEEEISEEKTANKPSQKSTSICDDNRIVSENLPQKDVVLMVLKRIKISFDGSSGYIGVSDFYKYTTNVSEAEDRGGLLYGTAFVTDNDQIVTARHVVQPWRFYDTRESGKEKDFWQKINAIENAGGNIEASFDIITSTGTWSEQITFKSDNISHDNDDLVDLSKTGKNKKLKVNDLFPKEQKTKFKDVDNKTQVSKSPKSDWVSLPFNIPGTIKMEKSKSKSLRQGQKLHILGYSHGLGVSDISKWVEPSYADGATVANNATLNDIIVVSGQDFGEGSSGGPAFICEDGEIICIGVVVKGVGTSNAIIVPVSQIRG